MNTRLLRLLRARRGLLRLLRERPITGTTLSILVHALVVVLVLWLGLPVTNRMDVRRGEPLFVELPQTREPAPRGDPAARERGSEGSPEPARPAPSPPPRVQAPPAPRPAPAPAPPRAAAAPPRVAAAPPSPRAEPARPARPAEPAPSPEPKAAPAPSPSPSQDAQAGPKIAAPAPSQGPAAPSAPQGGPAVAALPRDSGSGRGAMPDMRSALRRGGAGGTSDGRGGIEGEPIPLDSPDPKYSDYLDRVRRMIKDKWIYPCIPNTATRQCEYKSAHLEIEFGIAKDGRVPFVLVRLPSQHGIYDEYAVNAIKLPT